ncbi:sensor histidine kinase [Nocardioides euryhalodurans]|uniref:histidine kinase n=1 Tax=Nocardioides euryhalodurans TaxID=2518370 RepID=A0A4P7GKL7_9ACTN|nr:HAMP domain-containing sensor histidine kinase [Nocardioides euryhalodurans]QBR92221.1 sensor histidine kinase [Nocardioides euryhalodurans]
MRRPATLASRLVVTCVALVAVVTVLAATATWFAVRASLTGQLDDQVLEALGRTERAPVDDLPPPADPDDGRGPEIRGQGVGTLTVFLDQGFGDVIVAGDDGVATRVAIDRETFEAVALLPADGQPHPVDLDGLGHYRVALDQAGTVAAGLPTDDIDRALEDLVLTEAALVAAAVLVATLAGLVVVRRQLRPLRQVAATAHRVATLPLSTGEVAFTDRVPDELTDDRTEVGQVGSALNTLLNHVEASLAARHRSEQQVRQFVADASHELRTPLATIQGYAELAARRPDEEVVEEALAKVSVEATRMTALVEDLLLLARLDSGRPLARDRVDLTRVLLEAVTDARVLAPDHVWRIEVPEEPVEVIGDEHRLHQVVTNLLTNARKYTPAGTTVTVRADDDGFTVHDDGPGFEPGLADRAFERFTRGDAARTREVGSSAGLGLALVQAIVTAHGGAVSLESRPGDTTLRVLLPR